MTEDDPSLPALLLTLIAACVIAFALASAGCGKRAPAAPERAAPESPWWHGVLEVLARHACAELDADRDVTPDAAEAAP